MKRALVGVWGLGLAALALPALGNDTAAELTTGGLVFVVNEDIRMVSEDLFISTEEIRVRYEFLNEGEADQRVLIAFPLPDIAADHWSPLALPGEDQDNLFGFITTVNGEPVETELHDYAFAAGVERSDLLRELGLPLMPNSDAARAATNALDEAEKLRLRGLGLLMSERFDAGQGWQEDFLPFWTYRATYTFEADFPVGEPVIIEHSYTPSVGGTAGVAFMAEPYEGYDPRADYMRKYCMDDAFIGAVERTMTPGEPWSAPFTESWISYILSTGANWNGPIGSFRLVIDKGAPENLVSFCGEGVEKIGPTTFEMRKTDFYPTEELHVLILNRLEPAQ
ncbi:protein of unknown function [Devosia enhydra]|uniref:DUF4424 domain-containing protein n=1 Tax=Devosia enhydra TaxID=665118 RepID=A0A1K2HVN6_9HYPH|nr:DUF4424 domain-containing protein [Devosia enhydra]SFZ82811.1 protein of unknown function [Devosia enhydra]